MNRLIAPFSWLSLFIMAATTALLTFIQTQSVFNWPPVTWNFVSEFARQTSLLIVPLALIFGAWAARASHLVVEGRIPGRGWRTIVVRKLTIVSISVVIGFTIGLAPSWIEASNRATSGGPDYLVIASGYAAVLAAVASGYTIGTLIISPKSIIAVMGFAMLLIFIAPLASDAITPDRADFSFMSVLPMWNNLSADAGWINVSAMSIFRIGLFLIIAISGTLITIKLGHPHKDSSKKQMAAFIPASIPLALIAVALISQPHLVKLESDPEIVCDSTGLVEVCMYASELDLLHQTLRQAHATVEAFGLGAFSGRMTALHPTHIAKSHPGDIRFTPQTLYDIRYFESSVVDDVARTITGQVECSSKIFELYEDWNLAPLEMKENEHFAGFAVFRMHELLSVPPMRDPRMGESHIDDETASEYFNAMDSSALRQWINTHYEKLAACSFDISSVGAK